jgi:Ca2+-binding RTX toxin-like protein
VKTALHHGLQRAARLRHPRRRTLAPAATVLAILLCLATAGAASAAGTVALVTAGPDTTLQFTAGAGYTNAITVSQTATHLTIADSGAIINVADPSCTGDGGNAVTCAIGSITRIGAILADGNDTITNDSTVRSVFDGGSGNDMLAGSPAASPAGDASIRGGDGDDTIDGRGGDDTLQGDLGTDHLIGGDGADQLTGRTNIVGVAGDGGDLLQGGAGVDRLSGGSGSDMLLGGDDVDILDGEEDADVVQGEEGDDRFRETRDGAADSLHGGLGDDEFSIDRFPFGPAPGADVLNGGSGFDEVSLTDVSLFITGEPSPPAAVTLDNAAADDGFDGQPVTLLGIDDVDIFAVGGSEDLVRGSPAANNVVTGQGNDDVDAGDGHDVIALGDGDDVAVARDGFSDRIACGSGTDAVAADQLDVLDGCEDVATTFVAPVGIVRPPDIESPPLPPPPPPPPPPAPPPAPVPDTTAPRCTIAAPATVSNLRRGIRVTATCDEASSLSLTLTARVLVAGGVRAARVGDLVVTTRSLALGAGSRSVRLTVSAALRRTLGRRASLRLQMRASDAAGNRRTTSKVIRMRPGR